MKITISESRLRQLIYEELYDSISSSDELPKGKWVLLQPGDPQREAVKKQLYHMVCDTYASIGGHVKVCEPKSLDRYKYWIVQDLDDDPEIDIGIFGKPDVGGNKLGGVGHDGSTAAKTAYKEKSASIRKGESVAGVGNWWGEVSGGPAAALIKRGAPSVSEEAQVRKLLDGDDIEWHGEYPIGSEDSIFKRVRGWYTKKFSNGDSHMKIIMGSPTI
tara:strand:+ start:475 stop:1125 length:651 start_codon:yes stop_codon:yes gene_type:complete